MACDPITRQLIVFGGIDEFGEYCDDTWAFAP
jgi:hypothetical protein